MKRILTLIAILGIIFTVSACQPGATQNSDQASQTSVASQEQTPAGSEKVTYTLEDLPQLPRSLGIQTRNYSISRAMLLLPLYDHEIDELILHGYTKEQAEQMNRLEFEAIQREWFVSPGMNIQSTFPAWAEPVDCTGWTYGEYKDYIAVFNARHLCPSEEYRKKLNDRQIYIEDAIWLAREYYSYDYDLMLSQPDQTLKELLEKEYQSKIETIEHVLEQINP